MSTVPVASGAAVAAVAGAAPAASDAVLTPPPAVFDEAPAPPVAPPSLLTGAAAAPAGGVWAVVIGIDDYPGGRSDLRASVKDADTVDYTLAAYGVPPGRRLVLRNRQASAAVITESLRWPVAHAGPDATAVFSTPATCAGSAARPRRSSPPTAGWSPTQRWPRRCAPSPPATPGS